MSKNIQHKRSSIAGNVPDDTQIAVGELAINFPDQTLYTKDGNGQIIDVGRSQDPEAVLNPDNCTSPEFQGGSGTESDPFQVFAQANIGDGDIHVATATITGLEAGQVVYIKDLQAQTNGDRFTAGARVADESGVLTVNITLSDNPQSSDSTTYQGKLRIGGTIYIDANVGVLEFLEGGSTLATPNTPAPSGPILWAGSSARIITATYPLLISDDGYYFTDKIEANLGTQIWTKWAGDPGSGVGIDEPHGTTIRGVVTDGIGAQFFQLTIDKKTAFLFHNFVDSDQTLGGTSESRVVTVRDVNSYVYPFGTSTGTSPEYAKNGGSWTATPATNAGSATDYMIEGDEFQLRHEDAATNDTASTYNFNMAGDSADWTTVTAPPAPTILQPKIASPATDGALDISTSGPFVSSDFEMAVGTDTHTASSWEAILPEWTKQTSLADVWGSATAKGIEWNGSIFCAVSTSSGKCATSPDGVTWTNQTGLYTATNISKWEAIAWDGNQFCATGWYGAATSPDGVTWTKRSSLMTVAPDTRFHGITWNGSIFCAIGGYGDHRCATSPDGVTWTSQSGLNATVCSGRLYGITWNGSIFCAVGDNSSGFTSPDGVNWTLRNLNTSNSYTKDVAWNGEVFVAVGSKCSVSTDGVTWTRSVTFDNATNGRGAEAIVWNGLHFVTTCGDGNAAISTDGLDWTAQPDVVELIGKYKLFALAYNGSIVCGVGESSNCLTFEEKVVASLDSDTSALTSWEPDGLEDDEDYTVRVKHHTATLNSEWSDLRRFKTEANLAGVLWTNQPSFTSAVGTTTLYTVIWTGTQFCSVGGYGKCATSPDGVTWTNQPGLASVVGLDGVESMQSVAWDGSQFCAVGDKGKCATSPDGVTWANQPNLVSAVASTTMKSVTWTGTQFCAVGYKGKCATSPDGVTWTNQPSLESAVGNTNMMSIAWTGTQFCAVGGYGACATSPDGVTWANQPSLDSAVGAYIDMYSVTWSGSQFCAVGAGGWCATSPDGVTWTNQESFRSAVDRQRMKTVTWSGTQFCAVGDKGKCATSPDGVTWANQPSLASAPGSNYSNYMSGVTWGDGQFCAVGSGVCATSP